MEIRKELYYSPSHEWLQFEDDNTVTIGLSDFAQKALSDLVFVELPRKTGRKVTNGKRFGNVESVKAVSPLNSWVSGTIAEINPLFEKSAKTAKQINADPYGSWLIKVSDISEKSDELMDAEAYEKYCDELADEYFEEE